MKDVYNELIAKLNEAGFTFSGLLADELSYDVPMGNPKKFNDKMKENLVKLKKAIQQTLINCS